MTAGPRPTAARPPADAVLPALPTMLDPVAMRPVLRAVAPADGARAARLLARLEATAAAPGRLVPSHGDCNVGQLLDHDGELGMLDFDAACAAPAALDLASYAANLVSGRPGDLDDTLHALDELCAGYGGRPDGLRWHLAAVLLRRSDRSFRRLKRTWPERTTALVDAAERVLPQ